MKRLYFNTSFLNQLIRNDLFFVRVLQEKQTKQYITLKPITFHKYGYLARE